VGQRVNWELFDRGVEAFTWAAIEEAGRAASNHGLVSGAARGSEFRHFLGELSHGRVGKSFDPAVMQPFISLRQELEVPFRNGVVFWRRTEGRKGDLQQEMESVIQVPGWSNIWTQPIQNRIDMLSTGIRTQVGVKVFGRDLDAINRAALDIERVLKAVPGARSVFAEQS